MAVIIRKSNGETVPAITKLIFDTIDPGVAEVKT